MTIAVADQPGIDIDMNDDGDYVLINQWDIKYDMSFVICVHVQHLRTFIAALEKQADEISV